MGNKRGGVLSIKTDGAISDIDIGGDKKDILFNWVALTNQVCRVLNVSPAQLAASMPGAIEDYLMRDLKYAISSGWDAGQQHDEQ